MTKLYVENGNLIKYTNKADCYKLVVNDATPTFITLVGSGGASKSFYMGDKAGGSNGWVGVGCATGGSGAYISANINLPIGMYILELGSFGSDTEKGSATLKTIDGLVLLQAQGGQNAQTVNAGNQENGGARYTGKLGVGGKAIINNENIDSIGATINEINYINGNDGKYVKSPNGAEKIVYGGESIYKGYGEGQTAQCLYQEAYKTYKGYRGGTNGYVSSNKIALETSYAIINNGKTYIIKRDMKNYTLILRK